MKSPEILRQHSPHRVEVSEGSKDASRRQAADRNAIEPILDTRWSPDWASAQASTADSSPTAQLIQSGTDTSDMWSGDDDISSRLNKLRERTQSLSQDLDRLKRSAP